MVEFCGFPRAFYTIHRTTISAETSKPIRFIYRISHNLVLKWRTEVLFDGISPVYKVIIFEKLALMEFP